MSTVILRPGRDKSVLRRHPWIFSGAIKGSVSGLIAGQTVEVSSAAGTLLGKGAWSPQSQIAVRMWSFDPEEAIDADFFRRRLIRSLSSRCHFLKKEELRCCRLVYGESDGLPGLVVDCYEDFLVCQFLSVGPEYWKTTITSILAEIYPCRGIFERSDALVREKEGLPLINGLLWGEPPPQLLEVDLGSCRICVDVGKGHKTGFYIDQREARRLVPHYAGQREVLNTFAYTGVFTVLSLLGGASHVTSVESSADALSMLEHHLVINDLDARQVTNIQGNAFHILRQFRDQGRQFDLVILDPPKFAENRNQLPGACRGYKDINILAMKLLRPGGILFTFSCSGALSGDLFSKIAADAAIDAGRDVSVVHNLSQPLDHPIALSFPEARYLKGLVCLVY